MTGLLKSIPNNTFFYIKLAYCVQVSHKEQIKIIDPGLIIEISTIFLILTLSGDNCFGREEFNCTLYSSML